MEVQMSEGLLRRSLLLAGIGGILFLLLFEGSLLATGQPAQASFDRLAEVITRNCGGCHFKDAAGSVAGALALDEMVSSQATARRRESEWHRVYARVVSSRSMPPAGAMSEADRATIRDWIDTNIPAQHELPRQSSLRRLTNYEYNRSIRDIFGLNFDVGSYIQKDNAVAGFTNNSAVAFATSDRIHQYLAASEFVSQTVLGLNDFLTVKSRRWGAEDVLKENPNRSLRTAIGRWIGDLLVRVKEGQRAESPPELDLSEVSDVGGRKVTVLDLQQKSRFVLRHDFPLSGTYVITLRASAKESRRSATIDLGIDGVALPASVGLAPYSQGLTSYVVEVEVPRGRRSIAVYVPSRESALLSAIEVTGPMLSAVPSAALPCIHPAESGVSELECATESVRHVASKAFRKATLNDAEMQLLLVPFRSAAASGADFRTALSRSIQAVLMDPRFLYRIELERPPGGQGIDDYEFATRLSYFLWGTLPDEELRSLAARRALNSPHTIRAQVKRMLEDPRAEALVEAFANGWLGFTTLRNHAVDKRVYPEFDEHLRQDMLTETRLYLNAFFKENWPIRDLVDSDTMFVNARLARHYGIENVDGLRFRRIQSPSGTRRGLLTQASVLTLTSHSHGTSIVKRGLWVMDRILCESIGEVPPGVPALEEVVGKRLTLRQQMEKHRANPDCAGCHDKIDPLGFSLENYDGNGRWRTVDAGSVIDARGILRRVDGPDLPFENFENLRKILRDDDRLTLCATRKLMTYALGRSLSASDEPTIRNVMLNTQHRGNRIQEVIAEIALSASFRGGAQQSK
jgi:mono/diheme cytochrome c family protein